MVPLEHPHPAVPPTTATLDQPRPDASPSSYAPRGRRPEPDPPSGRSHRPPQRRRPRRIHHRARSRHLPLVRRAGHPPRQAMYRPQRLHPLSLHLLHRNRSLPRSRQPQIAHPERVAQHLKVPGSQLLPATKMPPSSPPSWTSASPASPSSPPASRARHPPRSREHAPGTLAARRGKLEDSRQAKGARPEGCPESMRRALLLLMMAAGISLVVWSGYKNWHASHTAALQATHVDLIPDKPGTSTIPPTRPSLRSAASPPPLSPWSISTARKSPSATSKAIPWSSTSGAPTAPPASSRCPGSKSSATSTPPPDSTSSA